MKNNPGVVLSICVAAVAVGTSGAVAGSMISGGTLKPGSVSEAKLAPILRAKIDAPYLRVVNVHAVRMAPAGRSIVSAACARGYASVGGGYASAAIDDALTFHVILASADPATNTYVVVVDNSTGQSQVVDVAAICAKVVVP